MRLSVSSTSDNGESSDKEESAEGGQPRLAQLRNSYTGSSLSISPDASQDKDRSRSEHRLKQDIDRERRLRLL